MLDIKKRLVVDEQGNSTEVIILWEDFQKIEEMLGLGLDLDEDAISDLNQARRDRERENKEAYVDLDAI